MQSKRAQKKREITKWKFYNLTNVTVSATLLREVPVGRKDAVLPERITKTTLLVV